MNCPHCHCTIDDKQAISLAMVEINKTRYRAKHEKQDPTRRANAWAKIHAKATHPHIPGRWRLDIHGENLRFGNYKDRRGAVGAAHYLRSLFPEFLWKIILIDPDGGVHIPRQGRTPGEIDYHYVGLESALKP